MTVILCTRVGLVGDLHGDAELAIETAEALAAVGVRQMVFLGDWGMLWSGSPGEARALDVFDQSLDRLGMNALVIGGNHENYDLWDAVTPDGDGARWPRERVGLLPRVWRAEVAGRKVAAFGGAHSVDIDHPARQPGRGWWPQEEITEAQLTDLGTERVDVLLAHEAPQTRVLLGRLAASAHRWSGRELRWSGIGHAMFQRAVEAVQPGLVFSGHYHQHLDAVEEFVTWDGQPFTTRSVILPENGRWPFAVVLDFESLDIRWPEPGPGVAFAR